MNWETLQQLVRIVMQLIAGWLVAQGWITEDMMTTLVGSVVSLGSVAWWVFWERNRTEAASRQSRPVI